MIEVNPWLFLLMVFLDVVALEVALIRAVRAVVAWDRRREAKKPVIFRP